MTSAEIISLLPYQEPFLFVDEIEFVSEDSITGRYTLKEDEHFYRGHFKDHPITPGVILTEVMAQIGVVCLGIHLIHKEIGPDIAPQVALTSSAVDFFHPVLPGEQVTVISKKKYFRFNKLKCAVQMMNEKKELVCRGEIAGMIILKS